MVPYLKGIHQTLDSWRPGRNTGWRLSRKELKELYASMYNEIGRLKGDVFALGKLMEGDEPYNDPVRVRSSGWVGYGMGDASRDRFRAAFHINDALLFKYGQWTNAISEVSSNYSELRNLVEAMASHEGIESCVIVRCIS